MKKQHFTITEQQLDKLRKQAECGGTPMSWQVRQALDIYQDDERAVRFSAIRSVLRLARAAGVEAADNALKLLRELEG